MVDLVHAPARSASSHEPEPRSTAPPSTTVELEEDVEEVMQDGNSVDDMPRVPVFPQELKRPASRKKAGRCGNSGCGLRTPQPQQPRDLGSPQGL